MFGAEWTACPDDLRWVWDISCELWNEDPALWMWIQKRPPLARTPLSKAYRHSSAPLPAKVLATLPLSSARPLDGAPATLSAESDGDADGVLDQCAMPAPEVNDIDDEPEWFGERAPPPEPAVLLDEEGLGEGGAASRSTSTHACHTHRPQQQIPRQDAHMICTHASATPASTCVHAHCAARPPQTSLH